MGLFDFLKKKEKKINQSGNTEKQDRVSKEIESVLCNVNKIMSYRNFFDIKIDRKTIRYVCYISVTLVPKTRPIVRSVILLVTVNLDNIGRELYVTYELEGRSLPLTLSIDSLRDFENRISNDLSKIIIERYNMIMSKRQQQKGT